MSLFTILTITSLLISIVLFVLSVLFKIAGKLRCSIPLLYFLLICTIFNNWASQHEFLALSILGFMMILVLISWIYSIYQSIMERRYMEDYVSWQIQQARKKGVHLEDVSFDQNGNMIEIN